MTEKLSAQEVALLIRARQLLKAKGLRKDADVRGICEAAGISRKTGYQWARTLELSGGEGDTALKEELARIREEHEGLKKRYRDLEFENEGHKLALVIHGVDEVLAAKKNGTPRARKSKR
jgi:transposase-like protein